MQKFTLESGAQVTYDSAKLGEYLMSIHASLFDRRNSSTGAALESLTARNARSALGMFADIIASPHVPTSQIGSAATAAPVARIEEDRIIRALMRGRYRLFNNRLQYVRNILSPPPNCMRPSNSSGFIHMRWFLRRFEYLSGITADLSFASYELVQEAAQMWSYAAPAEPGFRARQRMLNRLADYFEAEYDRRISPSRVLSRLRLRRQSDHAGQPPSCRTNRTPLCSAAGARGHTALMRHHPQTQMPLSVREPVTKKPKSASGCPLALLVLPDFCDWPTRERQFSSWCRVATLRISSRS